MASTTRLIALSFLIILAAVLCACEQKPVVEDNPQLQILEQNLSFHNFGDVLKSMVSVNGKAKNISNTTINAAYITVRYYDKDNNLLHTASASKNGLTAGEIWYFNVQYTSPDAWKTVRYDVSTNTK